MQCYKDALKSSDVKLQAITGEVLACLVILLKPMNKKWIAAVQHKRHEREEETRPVAANELWELE